jgi:hypothetical protein
MKTCRFILTFMSGIIMFYLIDTATVPRDKLGTPNPPLLWPWPGERQSLLSLAPNNQYRVSSVYRAGFWGSDPGINLYLQSKQESRLLVWVGILGEVGSERILWNRDGNRFLLVGRHFIQQIPNIPKYSITSSGEFVYMLYDVSTQQIYCYERSLGAKACLPLSKELLGEFE